MKQLFNIISFMNIYPVCPVKSTVMSPTSINKDYNNQLLFIEKTKQKTEVTIQLDGKACI